MPDVAPGLVERHLDAGDFTGQCDDHIAPGLFRRLRIDTASLPSSTPLAGRVQIVKARAAPSISSTWLA